MSCILGSGVFIDKFVVYTDGAARGNPGPSASGYMVYNNEKLIKSHSEYNGIATNNYAEYKSILIALKWCESHFNDLSNLSIEFYSDSELVVRQFNKEYKVKSALLKPIHIEINELIKKFKIVKFNSVKRENPYISAVDRSLNLLLDETLKSEGSKKLKKL